MEGEMKSGVRNEGLQALEDVLSARLEWCANGEGMGLIQGLQNIASMAPLDPSKGPTRRINGTGSFAEGVMGFRRENRNLNLAVVGGKAPSFYLPLDKLILLVERMHDPERRTVIIRNCSEQGEGDGARGQILARINPGYSALHVVWGIKGKVIREEEDVAKPGVYYLKREDLLSFYLAAKSQIKGGDHLEEMLRANEGWREYNIPTNPLDPGAP